MNMLYYNEQFLVSDGSHYHAENLFESLKRDHGVSSISKYPNLAANVQTTTNNRLSTKSGVFFQIARYLKRQIDSQKNSAEILRMLRRNNDRPDVLLARYSTFDRAPIILKAKIKPYLVSEFNTPYFYEIGRMRNGSLIGLVEKWERKILEKSELIYAVSNTVINMLCDRYGFDQNKFISIPNGFDNRVYPQSESEYVTLRREVRARNNLEYKFVLTFVGSLKIWHGIDTLIKIAKILQSMDKDIVVLVIGDGEMRSSIIEAQKSSSNIIFKGSLCQKEMSSFLVASDLGLMPYPRIEEFYFSPLKMYDMIGASLPFVASYQGQIQEFLDDNPSSSFKCVPGDIDDFIDKILSLKGSAQIEKARKNLRDIRCLHSWEARSRDLVEAISSRLRRS